ncbi:MAG: hypothetical protein IPG74_16160 [Flavobacteriales bacterium]|nr:hypothetical protein [Flavobacteriales bacterium]
MHHYMPVIVDAYPEFTRTFGGAPAIGHLLRTAEQDELVAAIERLLNEKDHWRTCAVNAHTAVQPFTWTSYVQRLLADVGELD